MKKIHFIAIGGSAMHNLAMELQNNGFTITGSDDAIFEPSKSRLSKAGLLPSKMGWFPEKLDTSFDAVILGMHAKKDNPELQRAMALEIPVFSYPEFLYEQSKNKTRVVIAGSHGKTTITSMVLHVLNYHGKNVDFMVGAQLSDFDTMVRLTETNDFMLIEGDEYLSSPIDLRSKFLWYQPQVALISGIAWDHINVFPSRDSYENQFKKFIETISPGGVLVYNQQDSVLTRLAIQTQNTIRKHSYDLPEHTITDGITYLMTSEGDLPLSVFGEHNLSNLAGAKWICQLMGIDEMDFYEAIESFEGAAKRLEKMGIGHTSSLFKDFAHAPSKVTATVKAVKNQYPSHKLIACLELHTYSSLNTEFLPSYKDSLASADEAIVFFDPDALKLKGLPLIDATDIKNAFGTPTMKVFSDPDSMHAYLYEKNYHQTVLLMMSSGNYGGLSWDLLEKRLKTF